MSANSSERFDASDRIQTFLQQRNVPVLLLLGDSGSGKSLATALLEQKLWQYAKTGQDYLPLRFELKHFTADTWQHSWLDMLANQTGVNVATLQQMKQKQKFLFIFDGFDELPNNQQINIFQQVKLSEWNCQVIIKR